MEAAIPDPRGIPKTLGRVSYASPLSYDGVQPDDYRTTDLITWFSRTAIQADAENHFERLAFYAWDGPFYWGVGVKALSSRVRRDIVAIDDVDLAYYGSIESKSRRQVADDAKGMVSLANGPFVEENVDVDIWHHRFYW